MMSAMNLSKGEDAAPRAIRVMTGSRIVSHMAGDEVQVLEAPSMDDSMSHGIRVGYVNAWCMYDYARQSSSDMVLVNSLL